MRWLSFVFVSALAAISSAQLVTLLPATGHLTTRAATFSHIEQTVNSFVTPNFFEKSANATNIGGQINFNWDIRSNGLSNSAVLTSSSTEFEMDVFGSWATTFNLLNTASTYSSISVSYVTRFSLSSRSVVTLTNSHSGSVTPWLSSDINQQGIFTGSDTFLGSAVSSYNAPNSRQFNLNAGTYYISTSIGLEISPSHSGLVNQHILFRDKIHVQAVPEPMTMVTLAAGAAALIRRSRRR